MRDPEGSGNSYRNGATVEIAGHITMTNPNGESLKVNFAGILWSKEERLLSSYLYSYDTEIGSTDLSRFEGLLSQPPLDKARPVALFRMTASGGMEFVP